jgi:hypothetical protein
MPRWYVNTSIPRGPTHEFVGMGQNYSTPEFGYLMILDDTYIIHLDPANDENLCLQNLQGSIVGNPSLLQVGQLHALLLMVAVRHVAADHVHASLTMHGWGGKIHKKLEMNAHF